MRVSVNNRGPVLCRRALSAYRDGLVFYVDILYFRRWVEVRGWIDDDLVAILDLNWEYPCLPDAPLVGEVEDLVSKLYRLTIGKRIPIRWRIVDPKPLEQLGEKLRYPGEDDEGANEI